MIIISFDIGIKNLSYCVFDIVNCKILEWDNICIIPETNKVKSYTIEKLLKKLFEALEKTNLVGKFENVSDIYIENQPTKNQKMKNIQIGVFSYFIMNQNGKEYNVKLISSKNKLRFDELNELDPLLYKAKQKYTERKKKAILLCNLFLKKFEFDHEMITFFNQSKKKDDLADSFLYCIYSFIQNKICTT